MAFFDDNGGKHGIGIHGIPVLGPPEMLRTEIGRLELSEVIIAMPSASAKRVGEVVRLCRAQGIRCETVPSLGQLAMGRVRVSQLREVDIEDLLGREPVKLDTENIRALLTGRVVMVTGAGEHRKRALPADRRVRAPAAAVGGPIGGPAVFGGAGADRTRPRQPYLAAGGRHRRTRAGPGHC